MPYCELTVLIITPDFSPVQKLLSWCKNKSIVAKKTAAEKETVAKKHPISRQLRFR
jgi:hypothetical protein